MIRKIIRHIQPTLFDIKEMKNVFDKSPLDKASESTADFIASLCVQESTIIDENPPIKSLIPIVCFSSVSLILFGWAFAFPKRN